MDSDDSAGEGALGSLDAVSVAGDGAGDRAGAEDREVTDSLSVVREEASALW